MITDQDQEAANTSVIYLSYKYKDCNEHRTITIVLYSKERVENERKKERVVRVVLN